jgi:penicillin-binding protein 2
MKIHVSYEEPALRELQNRGSLLYLALGSLFSFLILRLIYLQMIQGSALYAFSEKNLLKEIRVQPPRGIIYDRNHRVIAENLPNFALTLSPQYIKDLPPLAEEISAIVGIPKEEIINKFKKDSRMNGTYRPVTIKNFLNRTEINRLELLKIDLPGIDIEELIFREYPYRDAFAHAIGYISEISDTELPRLREKGNRIVQQGDVIGKSGLEDRYDDFVRGVTGISYVKVDAKGREALGESLKFLGSIEDLPPKAGQNIETTLDLDLQLAAQETFIKHKQTGALVALNKQGEVLALYNNPSFDPGLFSKGITGDVWSKLINNPDKPLRNKAIQDHHSPGSTFKPFIALASLQDGNIKEHTLVNAPPVFMFGNRPYHDHTKTGQGYITVTQAIEMSSNVFFYKQGLATGVDKIALYTKALGLGARTDIDLKNEVPGLIPTSEWKQKNRGEPWQEGENISIAIGQGFVSVTTLQLASAYMAIANSGKVYKPMVVKKIMDTENRVLQEFSPTLVNDLTDPTKPYYVSPDNFRIVQKGLFLVANGDRGTARGAKIPGFVIAGKTGTAQVRGFSADQVYANCYNRPKKQRHNGLYIAYGPYEDPEITVAVLTEGSCSSKEAVPLVKEFYEAYVKKYHPQAISQNSELDNRKSKQ